MGGNPAVDHSDLLIKTPELAQDDRGVLRPARGCLAGLVILRLTAEVGGTLRGVTSRRALSTLSRLDDFHRQSQSIIKSALSLELLQLIAPLEKVFAAHVLGIVLVGVALVQRRQRKPLPTHRRCPCPRAHALELFIGARQLGLLLDRLLCLRRGGELLG